MRYQITIIKFCFMITLRKSFLILTALVGAYSSMWAENLVIIHTNDTHSQIDPMEENNLGGIMRRKTLIDSIRANNDNVLLVDAGDAVQGTLFFNIGKGEVEEKLMNALGYDYSILGNHEFDNGMDCVRDIVNQSNATWLSSNYRFDNPDLASRFKKYDIVPYGDKKIGLFAINLDPEGMITEGNYDGVIFVEPVKTANIMASLLKDVEGVDLVVALTHIGYENDNDAITDSILISQTENIDIVIGGHSHTLLDPNSGTRKTHLPNLRGKDVLVAQLNKGGQNIGVIDIDLDDMNINNKVIEVNNRLDPAYYEDLAEIIAPYRVGVDSLLTLYIAKAPIELDQTRLLNMLSDFVFDKGKQLAKNVDLSIVNKGGIRRPLPAGQISEGQIMMMQPFNNYVQVIEISGQDLLDNFDIMAKAKGQGISSNVEAIYDPATNKAISVKINGKPINPDKIYRLATIDYLSKGGDYMKPLRNGKVIAQSDNILHTELINYLKKMKTVKPSDKVRMKPQSK